MENEWKSDPEGRQFALSVALGEKQIKDLVKVILNEWMRSLDRYGPTLYPSAARAEEEQIYQFLVEAITRFDAGRTETIDYLHRRLIGMAKTEIPQSIVIESPKKLYGSYSGAPEGWTVIEPPAGTLYRYVRCDFNEAKKTITVVVVE